MAESFPVLEQAAPTPILVIADGSTLTPFKDGQLVWIPISRECTIIP